MVNIATVHITVYFYITCLLSSLLAKIYFKELITEL